MADAEDADKSLTEILQQTLEFERHSQALYDSIARRISDGPIRRLMALLAGDDAMHYHLFRDLADGDHVGDHRGDRVRRPAGDKLFCGDILPPHLDDYPGDTQSLLEVAVTRKEAAADQYAELAEATPVGPIQDLYRFVADEEAAHIAALQRLIDGMD